MTICLAHACIIALPTGNGEPVQFDELEDYDVEELEVKEQPSIASLTDFYWEQHLAEEEELNDRLGRN